MATTKGVGAELKLSVSDALEQIKKVQEKLTTLRSTVSSPLSIKVTVDTSELDKAATTIKQTLNTAAGGNTKAKVADLSNIEKQMGKIIDRLEIIAEDSLNLNTQVDKLKTNVQELGKQGPQVLNQTINNLKNLTGNVQEQRREVRDLAQEWLNLISSSARGVAQIAKAGADMLGGIRSMGVSLLSNFKSFASSVLDTVGFSVSSMVDDAIEQERKLQQSQIGFANMFPGENVSDMINKVRTTAAASPGLNSGDLADYINQLGAVSNGNFNTAFNATMGILKTVQYGGGDAASQMGYIIKNIRDVMAKGKGTQIDVQQFNRAMPLLQKSLQAIGASEFLKDGSLTITKDNARNLMQAFAQLNTEDNPAYNIFSQTARTLGGLQEEFRETITTKLAKTFEDLGLFDALADLMRGPVFSEIGAGLESFANWLREIGKNIDWVEVGKTASEVLDRIKTAIGGFATMIKDQFGNTEFIKIVFNTIGSFFEGLINGATEVGKFLAHIKNTLGEEGLSNLAKSLGQLVTQGFLAQKVLEGVATAFGGIASILQTAAFARFLSPNLLGGKSGGTVSTSGTVLRSVGGGIGSVLGNVLTKVGLGTALGAIVDASAEAVSSLHLFGSESTKVANIIDVVGTAFQFGIYGSVLGPLGTIGGAVAGVVIALQEATDRINKIDAQAAEDRVKAQKTKAQDEVVAATIAAYKSVDGNVFDERTEAADWVKTQLYDYLQKTPVGDWDKDAIYDRFVSAYRQKLGHETMTKADNLGGFWELPGEAVEFVSSVNGQPVLTDYGERLAKLIQDYNLVGYDSYDKLMNTSPERLVNEYLQNETLNKAQIKFLEQEAKKFESEVGIQVTKSRDEISKAIEDAGSLSNAIEDAKKSGDDYWIKFLEAHKAMQKVVDRAVTTVRDAGGQTKYWTSETAEEILGTKGKEQYEAWRGKTSYWDAFFNKDINAITSLFGTNDVGVIVTRIARQLTGLYTDMNNEDNTEEEREAARRMYEAYTDFIENFKEGNYTPGDWAGLRSVLNSLIATSLKSGSTDILGNRLQFGFFGNKWTLEDWIAYIKAAYKDIKLAHGGYIKPVFRAGGGLGVDTVPAYLQPGEFVQRASAVSTAGLGVMNALNNGDLAAAYRMIGSKISGHWNNSRSTTNTSDNRRTIYAPHYTTIRGRAASSGFYNSWANRAALGF